MEYGESSFDILYLLFAIISGCVILLKARNRTEKLMGLSALILGFGDAFHLVPRVLNYFISADMTVALGIGKLITSVTMTVFYVLLYYVWLGCFKEAENKNLTAVVWASAVIRIVLCLFPQNGWLENSSDMTWGIIRNVPFVVLGGCGMRAVFLQKRCVPQIQTCLDLYYAVLPVLYSGSRRGRGHSDARNADAPENGMLYSDDSGISLCHT